MDLDSIGGKIKARQGAMRWRVAVTYDHSLWVTLSSRCHSNHTFWSNNTT